MIQYIKAKTKGGVILEDIKIGDTHYESEYGHTITSIVETKPERIVTEDGDVQWRWTSKIVGSEVPVNYLVTEGFEHYGPNLYNYEAYINPERLR